ncbi:MAG: M20/M25/M40 family metallo-hydrolase, partial [Pirellulaceae bacterium]
SRAKVLNVLEESARDVVAHRAHHPLVGRPSLSVGLIAGGISVNTVPDFCAIQVDRRVLPTENGQQARDHVIDYIAERVAPPVEVFHETPMLSSPGLSDARNSALAARLASVIREHGGAGNCVGVPYGTNAPAYDRIGAPTVVFGPGSIAQAHTADEWIEIEELHRAVEMLTTFGARGL